MTAVLHTWGSALTHHPHVHMIVPGGGLSLDGERFISCRRGFFLPVRVLSRLFRRLVLEKLAAAYEEKRLALLGTLVKLSSPDAFAMRSGLSPGLHNAHLKYSKQNLGFVELARLVTAP